MLEYFAKNKNRLIYYFTFAYVLAFTVNGFLQSNFEFLYYTVLMSILIMIVMYINKKLHLAFFILVNLSLIGFLHLLGGNFFINGVRLYDVYFIQGFFRYDNFIHTYAIFITTLTSYSLLSNFVDERIKDRYWVFAIILILMALGIGTVNEMIEFLAVLFFDAQERVGDYFNNSLDLWFNTVGAIFATIIIYFYIERPRFIKKIDVKTKYDN